MRFLLDMGISNKVDSWLSATGHDTIHIRDNGLHNLEDYLILDKAINENRIILTADMDFGQLIANAQLSSISLVQFRVTDFTAPCIISKLSLLLEKFSEQLEAGYIFTVEDERVRLRKLPI